MRKNLFSALVTSILLSVPVLLSAGVCIPGLGCFSGVEGCEITTPWYNPGYLVTYQLAIEKNAVGAEFGERYPGTDRWGFLHYRLGENFLGFAANRKQYLGGYPFDTTYFRPRITVGPDVFPYMLDSFKPPTYIADFIFARKMFGGGGGLNLHFGSQSKESEYDYFFTQSHVKAEPDANSLGGIFGVDNKNYYLTVSMDYLSWNSLFEVIDSFGDTVSADFTNSYSSASVNLQYKKWTDQTRYFTLPTISFTYDRANEKVSSALMGLPIDPENRRNKYSITAGVAFDDMGVPNSFSAGVNFVYTKTVNDFKTDTVFTDVSADTLIRRLPGKAEIEEYTFPQVYISANFFIWKWLSANTSVNHSLKYVVEDVERSNVEYDGSNYQIVKNENQTTRWERDLTFDLGAEITIHEDLKINFKIDDLALFNVPYLVSGDNSFEVITKLTVWYQF
ncbi:hypothetical protein JXA84_09755 [candidate division WOR-3 bacterium]|nr:hypothetical protein [candidate division WOR-3 bacterium]